MNITEKVCIVSGGATGLGLEIVKTMLNAGANVVALDINEPALGLIDHNACFLPLVCDITNTEDIEKALIKVDEKFGRIDILVNNAGVLHSEPLISILSKERRHSVKSWDRVIDLNLKAPFILTSYVAEKMVMTRTKGVLINISSVCSAGNAGQSAYSAAKAGVESLSKVWAKELGPMGIRSIAIAPGYLQTESTHNAVSEKTLTGIKKSIPLGRLGAVTEIAETVKFIVENDYITGTVVHVNGGLVL